MGDDLNIWKQLDNFFSTSTLGIIWFLMIAAWGGTANYISRVKRQGVPFSVMELIGEWTVSAFAGLITAFICLHMELSYYATAALVAIAGHMGGRGIALLEQLLEGWLIKRFGGPK